MCGLQKNCRLGRQGRGLRLEQVNVVAGPNGCGKTNLYRSMYLLSAAVAGNLARTPLRDSEGQRVSFPLGRWGAQCRRPTKLH
jgi:hypothetical protein